MIFEGGCGVPSALRRRRQLSLFSVARAGRQILHINHIGHGHHARVPQGVFQFPHIPRPGMPRQGDLGPPRQAFNILFKLLRKPLQEKLFEQRQILFALRQGWRPQLNHRQPIVQIFAEGFLGDHGRYVAIRRRHHTHVHLARGHRSHPGDFLILQHPQQFRLRAAADDNPTGRELIREALEDQVASIIEASDGREALRKMRETPVDLVLLDIQMPEMDGYQVGHEIRADPALKNLRVVALTAFAMQGDRERALAAGFDDYITKPVTLAKLKAQLDGGSRQ